MVIEKEIMAYLKTEFDSVYFKRPTSPPSQYILIEKTGGSRENRINKATFVIQAVSEDSLLDALELMEDVKTCLDAMAFNTDIYSAQYQNDYDFTDTTTKVYRYQAVYDFYY